MDGAWWERERALPVLEHQQARPHARPRHRRRARAVAPPDRGVRRRARELLAARARELRPRLGARSARSTRAASSCACPRSGCRARGATTWASRRRWSRSRAWRGSPATPTTSRASSGARAIPTRACTPRSRCIVGSRRARGHRAREPARGDDGRGRAQRRRRAGARGDRLRQPARARRQPQPERRAAGALPRAAATRRGSRSRSRPTSSGRRWSTRSARPAWATDRRFATYAGRRARHDELDAHLGAVGRGARRRRGRRAARRARRARPRVGRDPRSMFDHPQLQRARLLRGDRPPGRRAPARRPRCPFRFASVDRWLRTPAPTLGQHNHEILVDDLGVDDATYQRLVDTSIVGDRPLGL